MNILKETWIKIGRANGWLKQPCTMHGPYGASFTIPDGKCVGCGKKIYWPGPKYRVGDQFRSFFKDRCEYGIIITDITRDEYFYNIYPGNKTDHTARDKFENFYQDFIRIGKNELIYNKN